MTATERESGQPVVYECDLCSATATNLDTLDLHRVTLSEKTGDLFVDICFVCRDAIMGTPGVGAG